MKTAIAGLPDELARALTWDQGKDLSSHVQSSIESGVAVYFCDLHSPWQRASNENTNGLLRQYFPKGTDLSVHSGEDLARAAAGLNDRPHKTLGHMAPSEACRASCADRLNPPFRGHDYEREICPKSSHTLLLPVLVAADNNRALSRPNVMESS